MKSCGKVHPFADHDGEFQPVVQEVIAFSTNLEDDLSGLPRRMHGPTLQSSDKVDLVVVRSVQMFNSFKSVSHTYPVPGPKHSAPTLGEFMFAGTTSEKSIQCPWTVTLTAPVLASSARIYLRYDSAGRAPTGSRGIISRK